METESDKQGALSQVIGRESTNPSLSSSTGIVLPAGAAGCARITMDFLDVAYRVRWELLRFDLKPNQRRTLDLFLLLTFDEGRNSKFVPNPQKDIADLLRIEDGDLFDHFKALERYRVLVRRFCDAGVEYRINPDSRQWLLTPLRNKREIDKARSQLASSRQQMDLALGDQLEESLSVLLARMGLENLFSESHDKIGAERPAILPANVRGKIPPLGSAAQALATSTKGEIPPSHASVISDPSSLVPDLSQRSVNRSGDYRLRRADPDILAKLKSALGSDWKGNEGFWTDVVKFDPSCVEKLMGDLKYRQLTEDIESPGRWMNRVLNNDGILEAMRRAKGGRK